MAFFRLQEFSFFFSPLLLDNDCHFLAHFHFSFLSFTYIAGFHTHSLDPPSSLYSHGRWAPDSMYETARTSLYSHHGGGFFAFGRMR